MELVKDFLSVLVVVSGAIGVFFSLKTQVDKLSIVVNNNTDEIKALRKIMESVSRNNDSELSVLKTHFSDLTKKLKTINHRLTEIEEKIGIK